MTAQSHVRENLSLPLFLHSILQTCTTKVAHYTVFGMKIKEKEKELRVCVRLQPDFGVKSCTCKNQEKSGHAGLPRILPHQFNINITITPHAAQ